MSMKVQTRLNGTAVIRRRLQIAALIVAFVAISSGPVGATSITGLTNGSITCGDKTFSHFAASTIDQYANTVGGAINVRCDSRPQPNSQGIRLQTTLWDVDPGYALDTIFDYTVTVNDPKRDIIDAYMLIVGGVFNGGRIRVAETLTGNVSLPSLFVSNTHLIDNSHFATNPQHTLTIHKDIKVDCTRGGDECEAFLSDITQDFSQTPVPEPGTLGLLGIGLLGLAGYGWRRRRQGYAHKTWGPVTEEQSISQF